MSRDTLRSINSGTQSGTKERYEQRRWGRKKLERNKVLSFSLFARDDLAKSVLRDCPSQRGAHASFNFKFSALIRSSDNRLASCSVTRE